jgi:hypothetical protein
MNDNNENKHNNHNKDFKHTQAILFYSSTRQRKNVHWKHQKNNNNINRFEQKKRWENYTYIYLFNTFIFMSMHITCLSQRQ